MSLKFSQTRVEVDSERSSVKLIDIDSEAVIIELAGSELDDAVRLGFIDREHLHLTLLDYHRIRRECTEVVRNDGASDVDDFLRSLDLRSPRDGRSPG